MPAARSKRARPKKSTPARKTRRKTTRKSRAISPPIPPALAPPEPPRDLTERERVFIEHYLFHHEIPPLLQMQPGPNSVFQPWTMEECTRLLADPRILAELNSRRALQEIENARQQAKVSKLTPEFVKANLVDAIQFERRSARVRAIEMGMTITGVLQDGQLAEPRDSKSTPAIYRALQTTTVQRVTETITQTNAITAEPEAPALPEPKLDERPTLKPAGDVEILDY